MSLSPPDVSKGTRLSFEKVEKLKTTAFYRAIGVNKERLGQTIERIGWDDFRQQTIPSKYNN